MTAAVLAGLVAGLGVWLLVRAIVPRPVALEVALERLNRPRRPAVAATAEAGGSVRARLEAGALALADRLDVDLSDHREQLRLVGRSREAHVLRKLALAALGMLGPSVVALGWAATGAGGPPVGVLAMATGAAGGLGWWLPDRALADAAAARRRAFTHALSSYLDLVNVMLAGGAGINAALTQAAEAGEGWVFAALRRQLDRARLTNRTVWEAFAELGEQLGIDELTELAASVSLVGNQGARIRDSLAIRGDSLRSRQLAATEAAAEAATEQMTIPLAVMLFGFLLWVAFPAVWQITAATGTTPVP